MLLLVACTDPSPAPATDAAPKSATIGYTSESSCSGGDCLVWHTFVADLGSSDVEVRATRPSEKGRTTSSWASLVGATVAVNGDFFTGTTPRGLAIGAGEAWGTRDLSDHTFVACDANDTCVIDGMGNLAATDPSWEDAVGGNGQALIHDGVNLRTADQDAACGDYCTGDHPRTAVGLSEDRARLYLVAAEGRRDGVRGPTLLETATFMADRGAFWAIMLDGGGSTTMVLDGVRQNALPDGSGERTVANHLALVYPVDGVVGAAAAGAGWWLATDDGRVRAYGGASDLGDASGYGLAAPIVGIAATPSGNGFWLAGADGGVFAFGDATYLGGMAGTALAAPVVGIAATPSGDGYWLVASDGGVFTFGDAPFFGSAGDVALAQPVVGMSPTPDGDGYWLVASDGGVFSYGAAPFFGSMGGEPLNEPVTGMAASEHGYWLVARDGGVFTFGDAGFHGSAVGRLFGEGVALLPGEGGYRIASARGEVVGFGALE
ncbi:MAG: phosphodiester glycosidase family protein [Myxococcota bacterium]